MRTTRALIAFLALALLAPLAGAHGHATTLAPAGTVCYVVTDGNGTLVHAVNREPQKAVPEFWIETNGLLGSGEARGPVHEPGGAPVSGAPYWDLGEVAFNFLGVHPGDVDEDLEDGKSGLQRGWTAGPDRVFGTDDDVPPDTQVDFAAWASACLGAA